MKFYAKCNRISNKSDFDVVGEDQVLYYTIKHLNTPFNSGMKIICETSKDEYLVNYNPFKFKNRYQIFNQENVPIISINVGLKQLHKIEYENKKYICKGNLRNISYKLYDVDKVLSFIKVIKKEKQCYFEIVLDDNRNIILALSMLIVAQSIRERIFMI